MSFLTIYRKTVADLSNPKLLLGYYVPFLVVAGLMALGAAEGEFTDVATLAQQEAALANGFVILAFFLATGFPFLALVAVLAANTLAREAETGTLRILLSKPTRRWEVLLATFAAIVTFAGLVVLANLLLSGAMLFTWSGADGAAISGGLFAWLAGHVAYGVFGAAIVAALGLALAVRTGDRLQTALGALAVPALYFAFVPVRIFAGESYEEFQLYLLDVTYHFGHAFVAIHDAIGGGLSVEMQLRIAALSGVYDVPEEPPDQMPESLDLVGHVPVSTSLLVLSLLGIAAIGYALFRFHRADV